MKKIFSNATVWWSQKEISRRESLVDECYEIVRDVWLSLNPAVQFERVETPCLTPETHLAGHVEAGFPLLSTQNGFLRPETTAGCIAVFEEMFPMANQRAKRMPFCVWQAGKSFRNEGKPDTMRATKLRLREFWQLEFELFTASNTKADYIRPVVERLSRVFGGHLVVVPSDDLPHYSKRTVDWEINGLEVAGCSERMDWSEGVIHEISIGLDRVLAVTAKS